MDEFYPYPIFLILKDKNGLVVGGGEVAYRKVCDLIDAGAFVKVIAPEYIDKFHDLKDTGKIHIEKKYFEPDDINGAYIVFAATNDTSVNKKISDIARNNGILVNVVDTPDICDFFSGAVIKRGPLNIAISTSGYSPFMAARIKREIEAGIDSEMGEYIKIAGEIRKRIILIPKITDAEKKKALTFLQEEEALKVYKSHGKDGLWQELMKIVSL